MLHSLPCVSSILYDQMTLLAVNGLQPLGDFLGCHEQVKDLDFGEVLDFGDDPAAADHDVAFRVRIEVDGGEDVLAQDEDLVGREGQGPEHHLVADFLHGG